MSAAKFLARLEGVRQRGRGQWMARCPSHSDKSPSLSIEEKGDGTVLVHCFAQCGFGDIVRAVGMEPADLFPASRTHYARPSRSGLSAWDVLRALALEVQVVALAAGDIVAGRLLLPQDADRVAVASGRIAAAWRFINEPR
jgi:hypothetical protein